MIFAQSIGPLDFVGRQVVRSCCRGISGGDGPRRALAGAAGAARAGGRASSGRPIPCSSTIRRKSGPSSSPRRGWAPAAIRSSSCACAPRRAFRSAGTARVAEAVDRLSEAYGAQVAFVPFGGVARRGSRDRRSCVSAGRSRRLFRLTTLGRSRRSCAARTCSIGMRLHALILAVRLGVPFLAIPYDPKVAGLCEDIDYPLAPLWEPGGAARGRIRRRSRRRGVAAARRTRRAAARRGVVQRGARGTELRGAGTRDRGVADREPRTANPKRSGSMPNERASPPITARR